MAAPRGISQPPTSFIGSQCQGIHHAPLNTYNTDKPNKEKNCTSNTHNKTFPNRNPERISLRARCSQPLSTNQTPHPTTKDGATTNTAHPETNAPGLTAGHPHQRRGSAGPVVSKPNSVSGSPAPPKRESTEKVCRVAPEPPPLQRTAHPTNRPDHRTPTRVGGPESRGAP